MTHPSGGRLRVYPVTCTQARCLEEINPRCYAFSVLGNDSPLTALDWTQKAAKVAAAKDAHERAESELFVCGGELLRCHGLATRGRASRLFEPIPRRVALLRVGRRCSRCSLWLARRARAAEAERAGLVSRVVPPKKLVEEALAVLVGEEFLERRLRAAREVADKGLRVAFHFHPMVFYQDWCQDYGDIAERLLARQHLAVVVQKRCVHADDSR